MALTRFARNARGGLPIAALNERANWLVPPKPAAEAISPMGSRLFVKRFIARSSRLLKTY